MDPLGSLRNEVDDLSNLIVQIQNRLTDTTRCWEADTKSWNAQIQALEERNAKLTTTNESLRARNLVLEEKTQSQGSETQPLNLIKERDIALCKLEHARQVIRDLVDERVNTKSVQDSAGPADVKLRGKDKRSSCGSDRTIRVGGAVHSQLDGRNTLEKPASVRGNNSASTSTCDTLDGQSYQGDAPSPSISAIVSVGPSSPQPTERAEDVWNIHFSQPKAVKFSRVLASWTELPRRLGLNTRAIQDLESLKSSTTHCMRVHIANDLAFVYDPIFLESQSATYLIDWGVQAANQRLTNYIAQLRGGKPVLHTFVFPVKKGKWLYIGAQTWKITDLWTVWPTLRPKSRHTVWNKLRSRTGDKSDEGDILALLDDGDLVQMCIYLGGNHKETSEQFSREVISRRVPETR